MTTGRLVAATHVVCIAALAALLFRPLEHDHVATAALLACFAISAVAANAVRRGLTGPRHAVFLALTLVAAAGAALELQHLVAPALGYGAIHLGSTFAIAAVIASINVLLATSGTHAAAERSVQLDDSQRVLRRMWLLGQQITLELDPGRVLQRFLEAAADIAQADAGALAMLGADGQLTIVSTIGSRTPTTGMAGSALSGAMGQVVRSREPWRTDDVRTRGDAVSSHALLEEEGIRSLAMIPLTRLGECLGVVVVGARTVAKFGDADVERVQSMADLLSVALTNAELVESLRQAEWRFRTLFRAAPDAVMTVLQSGRVRDANDAVRHVVGLDPAHVVGRLIGDLVAEEDRPRLADALHAAFGGTVGHIEVSLAAPAAGEGRTLETAAGPIRSPRRTVAFTASRLPEADPPSVLLVGRDMSAERDMRARLMESDRLAAVGELVAGVAHEVNNPLSSISAFAQLLLRDGSLTGAQRESIDVIRSETMRASQVVKDLLAFARRNDPLREPLDINGVVQRSLRLRQYQLTAHGVKVEVELDDRLPAVIGDARQLQQVCLNLLTNAIQAIAAAGGGLVRVVTRRDGAHVLLEVSDTGHGIPAEVRTRIFEPFFTTKGEGEGTGLGLSVSYGIAVAHGGAITVADTSPAGTTIRVSLPAADVPASDVAVIVEPGLVKRRSALAGVKLLFVDDEPSLRASMQAFAELRGFTVVTAADGLSALEIVQSVAVDAVICDLRMPGLDGPEFHERLRETRPGLATRTIFVTGDVVSMATRVGARQPIVMKPFAFEHLEEVLVAVLRGTPIPEASRAGSSAAVADEPKRVGGP